MEISGSSVFNVHSSINHVLLLVADFLVILISIFLLVSQSSIWTVPAFPEWRFISSVALISGVFNCGLGLVYLGSGFYILGEKLTKDKSTTPLDE